MELRGRAVLILIVGSPLECLYKSGWMFMLLTLLLETAFASGMGDSLFIRLAGGSSPSEGRIEILFNNSWGTVCDDYFNPQDGSVVCRQLNYTGLIAVKSLRFGPGMGPIWLDDVDCTGRESSIGQCQSQPIGVHNCGHNEDVGVICDTYNPGEDGAIRLAGGSDQSEGRVEIFHDGEWGTVCNEDWDMNDANVVCRQLGYAGASSLEITARPHDSMDGFGLIIWLSRLQCSGLEERLDHCPHGSWGDTSVCSHVMHDVSVRCQGQPTPTPTLVTESSIDIIMSSSSVRGEKSSTTILSLVGGAHTTVNKDDTILSSSAMETRPAPSNSPTVDLNPGQMTRTGPPLTIIVPIVTVLALLFLVAIVITIGGVVFYFRRQKRHKFAFDVGDHHANKQDPDRQSQESIFTNTSINMHVNLVTHA